MIEAKNLTMHYGTTVALDQVSFKTNDREILGLLGPNGAGKTTLMRILSTFIVPAEGTATVGGYDIHKQPLEVRRLIGYLPETAPLYLGMQVDEYLRFIAKARNLSPQKANERMNWVLEATSLKKVFKKSLGELSKGYRHRVGLAQALIHDPQVLILDEPTSGLDPLQIIEIRELIRRLAQEKTIILSTHIMQEASAISDRILIINEGEKIADGTLSELQDKAMQSENYHLTTPVKKEDVEQALHLLGPSLRIRFMGEENGFVTFELKSEFGSELWREVDKIIKENNWPLRFFGTHRLTLEETFLELTRISKKERSTDKALFI